jgi:hypothetical protein
MPTLLTLTWWPLYTPFKPIQHVRIYLALTLSSFYTSLSRAYIFEFLFCIFLSPGDWPWREYPLLQPSLSRLEKGLIVDSAFKPGTCTYYASRGQAQAMNVTWLTTPNKPCLANYTTWPCQQSSYLAHRGTPNVPRKRTLLMFRPQN